MKKLSFILFIAVTALFIISISVFADQNGNDNWCNIDGYGCWVTGSDNQKEYLMFWSESSRQYFMGDTTPPYTNVVDYSSYVGEDKMSLNQNTEDISGTWKEALEKIYRKYEGFLYTKQYANNEIKTVTKLIEKNLESGKWQEKNAWNYVNSIGDNYKKIAEKYGFSNEED